MGVKYPADIALILINDDGNQNKFCYQVLHIKVVSLSQL